MDKWEIQQRINTLRWRRTELEDEISNLENKREYIELEFDKKQRQARQLSVFYQKKRNYISALADVAQGNAVTKLISECGNIYGTSKEENIASNLCNVRSYLKSNCNKIDERIEDAKNSISSIDWQIYCYEKDLMNAESEE